MTEKLVEKASEMGRDYGVSRGSWVTDGNTPDDHCRKIIEGYDDGDPEIMDLCPAPLSGEWADAPTVYSVLRELGIESNQMCEKHDHLIDAYEDAFYEAFWDTAIQGAYAKLPEYEPCGVCGKYGHRAKEHD